jgi:hypothetical protein
MVLTRKRSTPQDLGFAPQLTLEQSTLGCDLLCWLGSGGLLGAVSSGLAGRLGWCSLLVLQQQPAGGSGLLVLLLSRRRLLGAVSRGLAGWLLGLLLAVGGAQQLTALKVICGVATAAGATEAAGTQQG